MTTDQIKNQITNYVRQFKENSGTFKSFEVIFDYVNFLESEPYLEKLLSPVLATLYDQMKIMEKIAKDNPEESKKMDNFVFDPNNPASLSDLPIFKEEIAKWIKAIENKENLPLITGLSIYLTSLIIISNSFEEIKEAQKANNNKRAKELIEIAKEESFSLVSMPVKDNKPMVITSSQYLEMCLKMVSKYILDNIDSQAFLDNDKQQTAISFDKDKSILNIYGQAIKIAMKNDKPTDHFILEAIFANPDKTEETYFKDIAQDYIKIEEYDSSKDWNRFRNACDRLNQKVDKSTNGRYKDFIQYSTGKTGWSKINPKYL
jgi:hypothetical protein